MKNCGFDKQQIRHRPSVYKLAYFFYNRTAQNHSKKGIIMQSFQYTAIYLIANFFIYMLMLLAIQVNCEKRFGRWVTILLNILSYPLNMVIALALPLLSSVRTILGWVYVVIIVQLLYKNKWVYKLWVASAAVLAVLISEAVLGVIMPRDASVMGELMQRYSIQIYTVLLFVNIIVQSINVMFVRLLGRWNLALSKRLQGVMFLIFPVSQLAAICLYFSSYKDLAAEFHPWYVFPVVLIYLIADIALFFSLRMSEKNAVMTARTEILEEEIAFQKNYHAQLASSYEQIRKLRHDIDNHLYTIQTMLKSGQSDEAARYAQEIFEKESNTARLVSCHNTVIASFLEKKKEDFETNGILLECEIHMPMETGISNPDLICAFGNILNNAQEACAGIADPKVELNVSYQEPYLTILCKNPIGKTDKKHRNRIPGMERGLGLLILDDLAKQYDGELQTVFEEGIFRTQLVLKGGGQDAEHSSM